MTTEFSGNVIQENKMQHDMKVGRYRHYKNKEYSVVGIAFHSETEEKMVLYRQEYGERDLWVRPYEMFFEDVIVDGKTVARFTYLGSSDDQSVINEESMPEESA